MQRKLLQTAQTGGAELPLRRPRIAITCGDPGGVGPEIVERWILEQEESLAHVALIGPARWLEPLAARCDAHCVAVGGAAFRAVPGKATRAGAAVALEAMFAAAEGCAGGHWDAVVTGPICKETCARVLPRFVGQTEFFAQEWGGDPVMVFAGEKLRVALATWHVPLKKITRALTPESLERAVRAAAELCRAQGVAAPRIGVCGLNPHAGEGGLLGSEEREWINPLLKRLRRSIAGVSETLPGDTVFFRAMQGEFDAVVALYHDQGLAPLKTVDFDTAVNVTLGLPFVRTSPDHGTAFSIAGKGVASGASFSRAVAVAEALVRARR